MYSCVSNTACESDVLYIVPNDIPLMRITYVVGKGETFHDPIIRQTEPGCPVVCDHSEPVWVFKSFDHGTGRFSLDINDKSLIGTSYTTAFFCKNTVSGSRKWQTNVITFVGEESLAQKDAYTLAHQEPAEPEVYKNHEPHEGPCDTDDQSSCTPSICSDCTTSLTCIELPCAQDYVFSWESCTCEPNNCVPEDNGFPCITDTTKPDWDGDLC